MTAFSAVDAASVIKSWLDRGMHGYYESVHIVTDRGQTFDLVKGDPRAMQDEAHMGMAGSFKICVSSAPLGTNLRAPPPSKPLTKKAYKRRERSKRNLSWWETSVREGNHLPIAPSVSVN
jgi:hypothetical protein